MTWAAGKKRMVVYVEPEFSYELGVLAAQSRVSKAQFIRSALHDYMQKAKEKLREKETEK